MASLGTNICNMIKCRAGEHCLFRSFGMGGMVDSPNQITRNKVQVEVNKWFPATYVQSVDMEQADISGEFVYSVKIKGA